MKIAVSADGNNLDAPIDPRFGRCRFFIIVDTDDMRVETLDNESIALSGGAGIQAAQFLASKEVEVVITGNIGPNAVSALSAAGIEVVTGQAGIVLKAIDDYKKGILKSSSEATVPGPYGRGQGTGMGMGRRMGGRGMGGKGSGQGGRGRGQ